MLGVRGAVIITHGRAKRRMIGFACEVAATTARTGVPAPDRRGARDECPSDSRGVSQFAPSRNPGGIVSGPELTVGRGVIAELVRLAAFEVPGVARVGRGGAAWRRLLGGPPVSVQVRNDRVLVRLWVVARPGQALGTPGRPGPVGRRGDRGAAARARSRSGHRPGRWRRGLTGSAAGGPAAGSPWRPCSRRTSASARRTRSWSATWPRRNATITRPRWPASSSPRRCATATPSMPRSPGAHPNTRSPGWPGWTGRCSVPPYPRCYTRPRRPGWRSPSGSSWHGPTVETRCDAS